MRSSQKTFGEEKSARGFLLMQGTTLDARHHPDVSWCCHPLLISVSYKLADALFFCFLRAACCCSCFLLLSQLKHWSVPQYKWWMHTKSDDGAPRLTGSLNGLSVPFSDSVMSAAACTSVTCLDFLMSSWFYHPATCLPGVTDFDRLLTDFLSTSQQEQHSLSVITGIRSLDTCTASWTVLHVCAAVFNMEAAFQTISF